MEDLEARVRRAIGKALEVEPETLDLASSITQEEGLVGGLHLVQAGMAIEEEFQLAIPDEDAEHLLTLHDFIDYVSCRLTGQGLPWERTDSLMISVQQPDQPRHSPTSRVPRKTRATSATPKTQSKQKHPTVPFHAWKFDLGRWEAVEDVVYRECLNESIALEEALQRLRYHTKPAMVMGAHELGMRVEVYDGENKEGDPPDCAYYIKLWIGQDVESIYVSTLPGLITLLGRLGAIVGNIRAPREGAP